MAAQGPRAVFWRLLLRRELCLGLKNVPINAATASRSGFATCQEKITMHVIGTSDRPDLPLAVVVGAGGLGMATARRMANSYRVLLADIDAAKADAEAERLRGEGCDATGIGVDITARDSVAALAGAVRDKGGFHAFVQVAGVNPVT